MYGPTTARTCGPRRGRPKACRHDGAAGQRALLGGYGGWVVVWAVSGARAAPAVRACRTAWAAPAVCHERTASGVRTWRRGRHVRHGQDGQDGQDGLLDAHHGSAHATPPGPTPLPASAPYPHPLLDPPTRDRRCARRRARAGAGPRRGPWGRAVVGPSARSPGDSGPVSARARRPRRAGGPAAWGSAPPARRSPKAEAPALWPFAEGRSAMAVRRRPKLRCAFS